METYFLIIYLCRLFCFFNLIHSIFRALTSFNFINLPRIELKPQNTKWKKENSFSFMKCNRKTLRFVNIVLPCLLFLSGHRLFS